LTTSSAAAAILEAAEAAAHPQDGGWKRSTRRRKAKQFRRSTSCPSVALLAYLRTQRAAVDAALDREQQRQPEENAVFLPSFPDPDVDGDHGGPPQEALDWEREHKGEADSRARLSYPQPPAIRIDIGDGLPAASAHYARRSTSAARAPGLHTHQRPASSDNRVWLVRHHPDEGHDYAEFALGEGDDDDDHEREDDERSEWMQVALEREQLERERAELFEVVRMWRDREEEHLTKEAKARRALKLLLQVNDNIEDDMRRRSYCGGGPPQRSRAIINDMEAEERRGDRRLSLVIEVLTRMAREQLEGNLLGFIRNSIDNTNPTSGAGHNKKPFAYVGTGHATSRYTHSRGASGHILDHSRFHYDPEEERHKAKKLGAKLNHHHHQQHEPERHQKKKSRHQQRNRQARAEAETKEAHDGRVGFSRARRFSTKQRYLEHLAATHYSHGGDDSDRRAVSMRNFKRPSLFAVVGGGGGQGQPVDSRRRAAVLQRRERMDRVASVATFDRRGRVDLLASANTDDEGDEGAEQLMEEEQHAKKELSDAVDAIVAVADQLAADESVEGPATTPVTTRKMMTASSEAVQRRKLMKRCLTDEIMNILRDSNDSDGMDSSASACGSVPRVRPSKSEEMTRPVASPLQRRNVIWRDHNVDDVDSNDSVDGLPQNLSTLAELAGSPVKRHPKAEVARPSRRESAEERRSRKQLAKKRAKLQRREMKKLEKRAKKEEKKRARVWMREVKDLKRQLRLQKKKRNKDKQQPDDDVDSSSQEVVAERLDEASAGKVGSSGGGGGGAKKHSHFFGKLRRKKDHTKKKNEDDIDSKNQNEDGDEEEETTVSPRQQRRRAFKSVSLRAMRKKDSTTPDHNAPTDEAAAEETTGAGGGGRLVSFWRKRPHSKKAKDTVLPQPQPQLQPGATAENDENETPTSSVNARLPMDALLANSRQTGSSAVGITEHDGDNGKYEAVEVDGDEDDEVEEEQLIEEDEDEEDELEEWERGKGKEVEQQQQLYEDAEEEEVRVAEDKSTAKEEEEEEQEEWRPAAIVPVATLNVRQTEAEIRYSVAVQAMGQPLFGESLARLIENQRLEEKVNTPNQSSCTSPCVEHAFDRPMCLCRVSCALQMLGIPTLAVPRVMYILCRALLQRSAGTPTPLYSNSMAAGG
jgi:hypothetical protein